MDLPLVRRLRGRSRRVVGHSGYCGFFVPRHHILGHRDQAGRREHEEAPRVLVDDRPLAQPAREVDGVALRHRQPRTAGPENEIAFALHADVDDLSRRRPTRRTARTSSQRAAGWQRYDQHGLRQRLLGLYGDRFDPRLVAGLAQALSIEAL